MGIDGSEGNSQTFNSRFGFNAKRETDANRFTLDLDYRKQTDKGAETANRASLDGRYELLFPESPWSSFLDGTVDYDEFNSFDVRLTLHAGLGYELAKSEFSKLAARVGCGTSREIGSPDESYVPEAVFGLDFEHRLGERHKVTAMAEYMPDMSRMDDFRLRSRASWEMLIDPRLNLSLKLSVLERFDSTPNGAEPNDLDYSAVLLWKF
ncbi:MAG: hypothetical protein A2V70_01735 [Planctomycetes bacterium RBG_13_63_9]|nr:MAG: hypothetical protein A2V70_01735 [Planctomycetes bacterium RBG_13_63_9]